MLSAARLSGLRAARTPRTVSFSIRSITFLRPGRSPIATSRLASLARLGGARGSRMHTEDHR